MSEQKERKKFSFQVSHLGETANMDLEQISTKLLMISKQPINKLNVDDIGALIVLAKAMLSELSSQQSYGLIPKESPNTAIAINYFEKF